MYQRYEALRNLSHETDYRVAKNAGVPQSTLSAWKYGKRKPGLKMLIALANYFGVTVDYFVSGVPS